MSKLAGVIASYEAQYGPLDENDPTHLLMIGAYISGIATGTADARLHFPTVAGPPPSRLSAQRSEAGPSVSVSRRNAVARRKADRQKNADERKLLIEFNVNAHALIPWFETEWCQEDTEHSREARKEFDDAVRLARSQVKEVHNTLVDRCYRPAGRGPRLHLESAFFINLPFEYLYSLFYPNDEDDDGLLSGSVHRICKHLRPLKRYLELADSKPDMDRVQRWQKKHNFFVKRIRDQNL